MRKLYILIFLVNISTVQVSSAQPAGAQPDFALPVTDLPASARPISPGRVFQTLGISIDTGFVPKSFKDMVETSSVIVKGRFGKRLSHQKFWGYGTTRGIVQNKYNLSDRDTDEFGLPLSEYEILIDEVLLGNIEGNKIVYRTYEDDPSNELLTAESVDRLFFLTLNPDGKGYSNLGLSFILNNRNGVYSHDDFEDMHVDKHITRPLPFSPTMNVEAVDQIVREEIRKHLGLN